MSLPHPDTETFSHLREAEAAISEMRTCLRLAHHTSSQERRSELLATARTYRDAIYRAIGKVPFD